MNFSAYLPGAERIERMRNALACIDLSAADFDAAGTPEERSVIAQGVRHSFAIAQDLGVPDAMLDARARKYRTAYRYGTKYTAV